MDPAGQHVLGYYWVAATGGPGRRLSRRPGLTWVRAW